MALTMGVGQGALQRAVALKNLAIAKLAAAETASHSPAMEMYDAGVLATSSALVGMMNGYYGNPKVAGMVGVDGVAGVGLHAAALIVSFWPAARAKLGDMAIHTSHLVANAALLSYTNKVFTGLGAQIASKKDSSSSAGYGGQFDKMAGVGALSADEAAVYAR